MSNLAPLADRDFADRIMGFENLHMDVEEVNAWEFRQRTADALSC